MNGAIRKSSRRIKDVRIVLRAPNPPHYAAPEHAGGAATVIKPVGRGFAVLDAFLDGADWLANQDIASRTQLPKATVSRLSHTLTTLGYLRYCERRRKYRLAVSVLSLGYAANVDTDVIQQARPLMQRLADDDGVFVALAGRDGLDMVLFENCHSVSNPATVGLGIGEHMPMASSPVGWALLACLHQNERGYLMDHLRPRHGRDDWRAISQKIADAEAQIAAKSWCMSTGDWAAGITVVAMPLKFRDSSPLVLVAAGQAKALSKVLVAQRLGPSMLALRQELQQMQALHAQD